MGLFKIVGRQLMVAAFVSVLFGWAVPLTAGPNQMPDQIDPSSNYLIFLHNYYVEQKGPDGACRYDDILQAFENKGFKVISEVRPPGTIPSTYARKVADQVNRLILAGVSPNNITVAGHSKGAVIGLCTASRLRNPDIRFVVMAGCGIKSLQKAYPEYGQLKGQFLSIFATSDTIARSCEADFDHPDQKSTFQEIKLVDSSGHKLFFTPKAVWIDSAVRWIEQNRAAR